MGIIGVMSPHSCRVNDLYLRGLPYDHSAEPIIKQLYIGVVQAFANDPRSLICMRPALLLI